MKWLDKLSYEMLAFLHSHEVSTIRSPRLHRSEALRRPARSERQADRLGMIDPCPGGRVT